MSISVLLTAELVPGRQPCWAAPPHALCAGSGWTGWRCAVAAVSELGSGNLSPAAEAFSPLLWSGMFCDASAGNVGHCLTAGCTSSRLGWCQSWVCGEHTTTLLCNSSMTFLKPDHTSGTPPSLYLLMGCISWLMCVGRLLQSFNPKVVVQTAVNQDVV